MVLQLHNGLSLHCRSGRPTFFPRSLPTTSAFQKRPFFSSPVKYWSNSLLVRCTASRRELQQSEHLAVKNPTNDEIQFPPLVSSLIISGLPPRQQSMFHVEAEERLLKIARHWQVKSFEVYCRLAVSFSSVLFSGTVSCDRLVAICMVFALGFMLDDLLFDSPNDLCLEEYGIDRSIRESPHKIGEFLHNLDLLFMQQEPPCDPTPIEGMVWELGQDMRRMSTPGWFNNFADSRREYHRVTLASHVDVLGDRFKYNLQEDLETFTQMRAWNSGGLFSLNLVELGKNAFLPDEIRAQRMMQQLTNAAVIQAAFVNDIFSYPKEMQEEDNPRNLIKVLMESEGTLLPQAAWRAVDLTNSYTRLVLELETQLAVLDAEPGAFAVRRYVEGVKEFLSGNIHWSSLNKRYRHPDSVFPELRAITNVHHQLQCSDLERDQMQLHQL